MSAATTYSRDTSDILDEQVDSSSILTSRLDAWRHAVYIVHNYAHQTLQTQNNITSGLSKQHKTLTDLPSFNGSSVSGVTGTSVPTTPASPHSASALAHQSSSAGSNVSGGSSSSLIAAAFHSLQKHTDALLQESDQIAASIKTGIIPQLDALNGDLEKHHKTLRTQGHKLSKEVEKHREVTMKHLEQLGRTVSVAHNPNQKVDPKTDPYVLHRKVRGVAAEQIGKENQFSESNLNVQNNFGSLEQHIIEVLQHAIASLNELTQRYGQATLQASASTERQFASIQPSDEWAQFKRANSVALVPDTGFQRDPSRVTFANSDAESTVPIIEGTLSRKGTVLKGPKPGYFVLTRTGFLHQFKSSDYLQDAHPELSLYIPESEISGLPSPSGSSEPSFKLVSRDSNKVLSTRHKYTFSASSYDELAAWHAAIAQVAGATAISSTLDGAEAEEDPGVDSVYEGGAVPGSAAATTTGVPTTATQGFGSPTSATGSGIPESSAGISEPGAGAAGAGTLGGAAFGSGLGSGTQGVQRDIAPQQPLSGLGQDTSQLGSGPQQFQSGLGQDASKLNSGPQQFQSGLGQDVSKDLSGSGSSGLGSEAAGAAGLGGAGGLGGLGAAAGGHSAGGLGQDASKLSSGPQQFQSGLGQDASKLSSGPQQFQSGLGQDASKLSSGPQQFQSGLGQDASKLSSGPQQFQSGLGHDASKLSSGPQQFQSGLGQDVSKDLGGSGSSGLGSEAAGAAGLGGAGGLGGLGAAAGGHSAGGLGQDASKLSSGPQQFQSGLGQDASKLSSGPQQFQSGLGQDASKLSSGPQQFQSGLGKDVSKDLSGSGSSGLGSEAAGAAGLGGAGGLGGLGAVAGGHSAGGLGQDASKLSSGPQQFQSGLGQDASKLSSGPQQFQSGLGQDASKLSSGPQQFQSGLGQDASKLSSGPQQFQSGLGKDVSKDLSGTGSSGLGREATGAAGLGGLGAAAGSGLGSGAGNSGSHSYSQFASDRQAQPSSTYSTPQQPTLGRFQDQRFGDDTTPFTTSERVEGLRLDEQGPLRGSTGGPLGKGPLTTSEQLDGSNPRSSGGYGNITTSSGYGSTPHSPTGYGSAGYGSTPRSPTTNYGSSNAVDTSSSPRSPLQGNNAFVGGSAVRSPKAGETQGFQGSRTASGTSGKSTQSGVPHYKISPSKRGTLQTDRVDGSGVGGTFGAIPVSPSDESPAREAVKEHNEKVPEEQDVHHHHHLHVHHHNQPEIHHKGHRHNPDEGLPGAHVQEKPREDVVVSNTPPTPRYESAKPTPGAQAFTQSGGFGSPRLGEEKHGFGNVKPKDVAYSNPDSSAYPTIAAGNTNPLVGSTTKYDAPAAPSNTGGGDLNNIASRDVQYSAPKPSEFSTIAAGNTNPLLDSKTHYNAPAAPTGSEGGSNRYADTESSRNIQYSRPDPSKVSGIAASNTNPLLDSPTHYNAPSAPSAGGAGAYGDSNLQSRAAQQFAGGGNTGTAGYSDLGSKSQKEPFTIVSTQDVPRGHARNASFETVNHDTGSRLDPLSSKYGATGASRGGVGSGSGSGVGSTTTPGVAAGTVGGGSLGYGASEFKDAPGASTTTTPTTATSGIGHGGSNYGQAGAQGTGNHYSGSGSQSGSQPGATRVTGAGGNSRGTHGFHSREKSSGSGGYGDYSDTGGTGSGSNNNVGGGLAAGAAGAGGAGALGGAGVASGSHQRGGYGDYSHQQGYGSTGQTQQAYDSSKSQLQPGYGNNSSATGGASGASGATGAGVAGSGLGTGAAGAGTGAAGAGAAGAGAAGTGAAGAGTGAAGGSNSQYTPYSQEQHGSKFGGNAGGYSQKDYSSLGPEAGGDAEYVQGPGSSAGGAKNKSGTGGGKLASAAGGLGALGGLAGMAGIPGGGEISQATGIAGSLGSGGVGNAVKSQIPGMGEASQVKNLATGNFGSAAKQEIPGANQASQFSDAAKDLRGGGGAADKAEGQGLKDAEKAGKVEKAEKAEKAEKPSGFKKLANVFKS